jgi:hypothetical protein
MCLFGCDPTSPFRSSQRFWHDASGRIVCAEYTWKGTKCLANTSRGVILVPCDTLESQRWTFRLPATPPSTPVFYGLGGVTNNFARSLAGAYSVLVKKDNRASIGWVPKTGPSREDLPAGAFPAGFDSSHNLTYICQPRARYEGGSGLAPAGTLSFANDSGICWTAGQTQVANTTDYLIMNATWDTSALPPTPPPTPAPEHPKTGCVPCCGVDNKCSNACAVQNLTLCTVVCEDKCHSKVPWAAVELMLNLLFAALYFAAHMLLWAMSNE